MPKIRPGSFPVTRGGVNMASKATRRNRNAVTNRNNSMNLQNLINKQIPSARTMPQMQNNISPPDSPFIGMKNTNQASQPNIGSQSNLTSTVNPQSVDSSGFSTSFSRNPIQQSGGNNVQSQCPAGMTQLPNGACLEKGAIKHTKKEYDAPASGGQTPMPGQMKKPGGGY